MARAVDARPGVRLEICRDYRDDYLGQQATKLAADEFTDADLICHVDADCVFTRPTTPASLTADGKVRVLIRPNALLGRHRPWQRPTEEFLGWHVAYDFMQHPPFTYPRWLYPEIRRHAREVHGVGLDAYVVGRPPRGFSEHNVLGAFAHARHRKRFAWVDTSAERVGEPPCRWYWSWGGLSEPIRRELDAILDMSVRPSQL